ncbi:MAG: hypothetical protein PHI63_05535 [Patescibacteria group bacterium]|nr:hypothetical protein [Patescibacteria group bacterium]
MRTNKPSYSQRQERLLAAIIEVYTEHCQPVGSVVIAHQHGGMRVSPATIRNDMAALEDAGLLSHPHTSAGRVPTAEGYRYYVEHALASHRITAHERTSLQPEPAEDARLRLKSLAKKLAGLSDGCVVLGYSSNDVYYTGLSNLFRQPEFQDLQYRSAMSEIIDHLDEVMHRVYDTFAPSTNVSVFIGDRNPFGDRCGVLLTGFQASHNDAGILGVLGPLRMDYSRNRALLDYARQVAAHASSKETHA